jgi:hypothetical protein
LNHKVVQNISHFTISNSSFHLSNLALAFNQPTLWTLS